MRYRIIPLMVTCFILLTSLSECIADGDPLTAIHQAPVSAEIDGVLFSSDEQIIGWAGTEGSFREFETESYFRFGFIRDVTSEDGTKATLFLGVRGDLPLELNKKYAIKDTIEEGESAVWMPDNNFGSTEGYIVFTERESSSDGSLHRMSGYFEFTAVDSENDDGKTIKVTNGKFEDLYAE